jgi:hypothetical protein
MWIIMFIATQTLYSRSIVMKMMKKRRMKRKGPIPGMCPHPIITIRTSFLKKIHNFMCFAQIHIILVSMLLYFSPLSP